jgi:murein DD-endopeptidase MepM/ murein hydrolase activator NlpD
MKAIAVVVLAIIAVSCTVSKDPQRQTARLLQKGKIKEDTSWVYALPYDAGKSHLVVQGYYSSFSHKNRSALDFKMKKGTRILAARDGVVVRMQEENNKGGWNKKYRQFANYVVVQHADSTRAGYWHLQQNGVLVKLGDSVKQGQPIALSGNTGYSSMPHLHFMVWKSSNGKWTQVPTRFMTRKGPRYLRPLRKYKY